DAASSVRQTVDGVKERIDHTREEVKVRAEAVAETSRRARVAPGRISAELGAAVNAWKRGLVTALVMGLVMAVFGVVTLVVLTIALVVGLNELVGDPAGTWIVALLYLLVIAAAYFVMRSRSEAAARERAQRIQNSRDEVRHVTAPVRSAFGGRGRAGF
ncbi:MAG TPA: phage holin family protein, partial [Candidatus Thermoplasmatota archaeon]|nr:phage holin family protein [Candidatus Thermoplasmatota archaeon]